MGEFPQKRAEFVHEGEFRVGAGFPTKVERGHEVAQLLAIKNHPLEDAVYEGLQGGGSEAVALGEVGELRRLFVGFEALVAVADGGFAEGFARFQGGDVSGDVFPLVHELGIGLDEADELFAAHLLLARGLLGEAGDQAHDVVVINDCGGEEDELEIQLVHVRAGLVGALALLGFEALGGFQILSPEAELIFFWQDVFDGGGVVVGEVGVLVELSFEALDFLEVIDEGGAGFVALEIRHGFRGAVEALGFHEGVELLHGVLQLLDDHGGLLHQPDFAGCIARFFTGEKGDGGIDGVLLLAEVEDVAEGLGAVEHAVGAGEGLDQAVMLEVLVHIERAQVFGIEAGEEHVHHDGEVDLLRMRVVGVGPLLVFDALLHILIVEVELAEGMIGAVAGVVIGEDGLEGGLFLFGLNFVVRFFLRKVFLDLLDVAVPFCRRRKDAGDV